VCRINDHTHETIWFLEALRIVERVSNLRGRPLAPGTCTQGTNEGVSQETGGGVHQFSRGLESERCPEVPKRHLWTRPALNMALNLRPRHRRPRIDRRAAPLVKWAMHSARPNFTSAAHREERLNEERLGRAAMDGAGGGARGIAKQASCRASREQSARRCKQRGRTLI